MIKDRLTGANSSKSSASESLPVVAPECVTKQEVVEQASVLESTPQPEPEKPENAGIQTTYGYPIQGYTTYIERGRRIGSRSDWNGKDSRFRHSHYPLTPYPQAIQKNRRHQMPGDGPYP